jgi:phosphate transport system substrate-binding protein
MTPCRFNRFVRWPALAGGARVLAGVVLAVTAAPGVQAADPVDEAVSALPHYEPAPCAVPADAGYVDATGTITITGYNDMAEMLQAVNAVFVAAHPGFKFHLVLKGTATGAPALMHGVSAFAPMGAEFSAIERVPYEYLVGAEPLPFRVAHCALKARGKSAEETVKLPPGAEKPTGDTAAPIGIFVHPSNPLARLTLEQVARIFSTGAPGGDITSWGQLGLTGPWAGRAIHPCGVFEEAAGGIAAEMLKNHLAGRPFPPEFDGSGQSLEVINRVRDDPAAIGFASGNLARAGVKLIALTEHAGGEYESLTAADVIAGKYPLDRYLYIYVRRVPGQSWDPFVKEYLRLVFSQEGQRAIARAEPGYLPLNAHEVAEELAKIP